MPNGETLSNYSTHGNPGADHNAADHEYKRDERLPEWHGWHAARRGLGSNLYRLGVPEKVIQAILRHANVNITMGYYIKPVADDVCDAMAVFEREIDNAGQNSNEAQMQTPSTVHSIQ
jgi:integrase